MTKCAPPTLRSPARSHNHHAADRYIDWCICGQVLGLLANCFAGMIQELEFDLFTAINFDQYPFAAGTIDYGRGAGGLNFHAVSPGSVSPGSVPRGLRRFNCC